jgi:hypothetical protein
VVVLETGDGEGDLKADKEDDVEIDKLVTLLLVDLSVDIVVGIEVMLFEELIAEVAIDDRDKLDVVEEVVLFRLAVKLLMLLDADADEPAGIVVYSTIVVNDTIVEVAGIVSLGFREIVRTNVEVDIIVVNVVDSLFDEDLGGKVTFFQAERTYKHRVTTFVRGTLTVASFESHCLMNLNPYKEPERFSKPHDGVHKGNELNMSNCKTKNEAKKGIMDLGVFCMARTLATCRLEDGYNIASSDSRMLCYLLHLGVGSKIACRIEPAAVSRLSRFGKSFELASHVHVGAT